MIGFLILMRGRMQIMAILRENNIDLRIFEGTLKGINLGK
jgi:hypothetical protein